MKTERTPSGICTRHRRPCHRVTGEQCHSRSKHALWLMVGAGFVHEIRFSVCLTSSIKVAFMNEVVEVVVVTVVFAFVESSSNIFLHFYKLPSVRCWAGVLSS